MIPVSTRITAKQIGDGGEYLVAGLLGLAGTPTTKMLDNQPGFDLIALSVDARTPQRISVKTARSTIWISYRPNDRFEWLAIVLAEMDSPHRVFIIPRRVADKRMKLCGPNRKVNMGYYCSSRNVPMLYAEFQDNFALKMTGA